MYGLQESRKSDKNTHLTIEISGEEAGNDWCEPVSEEEKNVFLQKYFDNGNIIKEEIAAKEL